MAGSQLSMSYQEMAQAIKELKSQVTTFQTTTTKMTTQVNNLCNSWKAEASPVYQADYNKLSKNLKKTSDVVTKLIGSTEKYISDMQQLDKAYAKSKVN